MENKVKVTLNKSGKSSSGVIRVGLNEGAASLCRGCNYVEVFNADKERVYFRFHPDKIESKNQVVKIFPANRSSSSNSNWKCFTYAPKKLDKVYRKYWIGHTYELQRSNVDGCFYLKNPQTPAPENTENPEIFKAADKRDMFITKVNDLVNIAGSNDILIEFYTTDMQYICTTTTQSLGVKPYIDFNVEMFRFVNRTSQYPGGVLKVCIEEA